MVPVGERQKSQAGNEVWNSSLCVMGWLEKWVEWRVGEREVGGERGYGG